MELPEVIYPLGNQSFEKIISAGKLYVDKTVLIYRMTHTYDYVFLSRPRRFGKSLLCSTLAAYFRGEKELFRGLHVESQVRTAKGRIDVVVGTKDDIYVMEVKLDRPAQEALEQTDSRKYLVPYTLDGRRLTKIGVSFSSGERNVTEWLAE